MNAAADVDAPLFFVTLTKQKKKKKGPKHRKKQRNLEQHMMILPSFPLFGSDSASLWYLFSCHNFPQCNNFYDHPLDHTFPPPHNHHCVPKVIKLFSAQQSCGTTFPNKKTVLFSTSGVNSFLETSRGCPIILLQSRENLFDLVL